MKAVVWFLLLTSAISVPAKTSLNGELTTAVFDSTGNPYIVESEIVVPKGKKLTINEGCIFYFKPFTGLTVRGDFAAAGSSAHPVVFTSINDTAGKKDSAQAPNAFDWNGITVGWESGAVALKNAQIRYSTFGIKSQNPDINIEQGIFRQNGQFHLTVKDKIIAVPENQPFAYTGKPAVQAGTPTISKQKKILRYSLLGVGIAGSVTGIILSMNARTAYNDWAHISQETNPLPPPGEYQKRQDKYHSALTGAVITDIIGGGALIGFGLTFAF
jgi:hypothetical protein